MNIFYVKIEQNEILNKHNSICNLNYYVRTLNIIEKQIVSNYNFNKYGCINIHMKLLIVSTNIN